MKISRMKLRKFMLFAGLCLFAMDGFAATVTAVRSWRAPDNTRLVLDLSETVRYRQVSISARQLVIELDNTDVAVATPSLPSHIGLMQSVQFQPDGTKQRLIINLSDDVRPHVFLLPANDKYSPRLVVDLFDKVTLQATAPVEEETNENEDNNGRSVIVVVDAGHGGEDSGAIGANGHYEKHVTLAIAKKLVAILRKSDGFKAYLTRDEDYFIPLQDRRKIARNRYKADIFISIHADSSPSPLARGASVFALSRKGATTATSRFAQALAEKENKSDLIGGVDVEAGKDSQLTNILADMVVEGSLTHSLHMGGQILNELSDIGPLHTRHIEQAGFAVLKEPGMISVLVETGFISNPDEEAKLTNPDDQQRTAQSVFNGVKSFMQKYPIPRTYFAWAKERHLGKQRTQALQAVSALPEPKPVKLEVIPVKRSEPPVVINKPMEPIISVANKPIEPEKKVAVDTPKSVVAEVKSDKTLIIESRPLSLTAIKPEAEYKTEVKVIEGNTATKPAIQSSTKATVTATLPNSLDDFMAGIPQPLATVKSTANVKKSEKNGLNKPVEAVKDKVRSPTKAVSKIPESVKTEGKPAVPTVSAKALKHKVEQGDSLSSIAADNDITLDDLKAWNKLKSDNAVLGTTLRLTAPAAKVDEGQSLSKPVDKNAKVDKDSTAPEKSTVKVNADKASIDKADKPAKTDVPEKTKATTELKASVSSDTKISKTHKVKEGDSLSSIASKYDVSEKALRETNHLKSDNVMLGQSLKIPTP